MDKNDMNIQKKTKNGFKKHTHVEDINIILTGYFLSVFFSSRKLNIT